MNTMRQFILVSIAALTLFSPTIRAEQSQKSSKPAQEDRIKKLEERADASDKAASSAATETEYLARSQKFVEAYYQKAFSTEMWALGIMGLILTGVFVLVARFSLKMIEEQAKIATASATVQMRNEYARAMAKEVQKLWDSNGTDIKKLKESLSTQTAELEQDLKNKSDLQTQLVLGLIAVFDSNPDDPAAIFRKALSAYKNGKARSLFETKTGATAVRYLFEFLQKTHAESHVEKAREELANPLYDCLHEELAVAALQLPWLTQLINERKPAVEDPPAPEAAAAPAPPVPVPRSFPAESELALDDDSDSCRLITT
ncbi:MAG TPA: hypothetical protein VMJ35_12930 [Dongiaceae bacterium]|nr:hypothetical protein [Dongiaceae bacterium]